MTIRTLAIIVAVILIVIFAGGFFVWRSMQPPAPTDQEETPKPASKPQLLRGPFDVPTNHEPEEHTD